MWDLATRCMYDYIATYVVNTVCPKLSTHFNLLKKTVMYQNNCRYLSERETADRNFCLGYYMKENKVRFSLF